VTIAAGFVCSDGVILCADTEETAGVGYVKVPLEKVRTLEDSDCTLAITGTGNSALLEMAMEQIIARVRDKSPHTLERTKKIISAVLLKLHKRQVRYQPGNPEAKLLKLLIAVKPRSEPCSLLHTEGAALHEVSSRCIFGGGSVVRMLADNLHHPALSLRQTVVIALYVLNMARESASAHGSASHMIAVKNDGKVIYQQLEENAAIERALEMVKAVHRDLVLICADSTLSNDDFRSELRRLCDNMLLIRGDCLKAEAEFRSLSGGTESTA
jgi:20S proteasome alpha/beta subunit